MNVYVEGFIGTIQVILNPPPSLCDPHWPTALYNTSFRIREIENVEEKPVDDQSQQGSSSEDHAVGSVCLFLTDHLIRAADVARAVILLLCSCCRVCILKVNYKETLDFYTYLS